MKVNDFLKIRVLDQHIYPLSLSEEFLKKEKVFIVKEFRTEGEEIILRLKEV